MQQIAELPDSGVGFLVGDVIQRREQAEILPPCETRIETGIGAAVEAQLPTDRRRLAQDIGSADPSSTPRGQQQGGQDSEKSRFSGAICTYQRYDFSARDSE